MNAKTQKAIEEMTKWVETGHDLVPAMFSMLNGTGFGRGTVSAAIRILKAQGKIRVKYISVAGTPVYEAANPEPVEDLIEANYESLIA